MTIVAWNGAITDSRAFYLNNPNQLRFVATLTIGKNAIYLYYFKLTKLLTIKHLDYFCKYMYNRMLNLYPLPYSSRNLAGNTFLGSSTNYIVNYVNIKYIDNIQVKDNCFLGKHYLFCFQQCLLYG